MFLPRVLGPREHELLDLVELVDAEHAARVLSGGACLAAEARREADVAEGEHVSVQDLVSVQPAEWDLGSPGEIEILTVELVDVRVGGGQPTRPVERVLANEHGWQHGHEPLGREALESHPVQRECEERRVADPVAET